MRVWTLVIEPPETHCQAPQRVALYVGREVNPSLDKHALFQL